MYEIGLHNLAPRPGQNAPSYKWAFCLSSTNCDKDWVLGHLEIRH